MRILIIRFSSFGDIFQALEAARHLEKSGRAEYIDWLVREDFAPLLQNQRFIRRVLAFNRASNVSRLIGLSWRLALEYDHVYDAHSNLRSLIVRLIIRTRWTLERILHPSSITRSMITRSKERIRRLLFFQLRWPVLPVPYRGAESFLLPLRRWLPELEFSFSDPAWVAPELRNIGGEFFPWQKRHVNSPLIALAPSAAWPNKRWPVERWRVFVQQWLSVSPDSRFLLLGGPEDRFLDTIENEFGSSRVFNAVGKTTMLESAALLAHANAIVANDTGLLHVADRLQIPNVGIIGPTAFGYTSSPAARIAEVPRASLPCKPCSKDGRDRCTNAINLKCLVDVSAEQVVRELKEAFEAVSENGATP